MSNRLRDWRSAPHGLAGRSRLPPQEFVGRAVGSSRMAADASARAGPSVQPALFRGDRPQRHGIAASSARVDRLCAPLPVRRCTVITCSHVERRFLARTACRPILCKRPQTNWRPRPERGRDANKLTHIARWCQIPQCRRLVGILNFEMSSRERPPKSLLQLGYRRLCFSKGRSWDV
jgi:hypothetical protein